MCPPNVCPPNVCPPNVCPPNVCPPNVCPPNPSRRTRPAENIVRMCEDSEAECAWLGDPCGENLAECGYGSCASDGFCSLQCNGNGDCSPGDICDEGVCVPTRRGRYGETCRRGEDCTSLLCLTGDAPMCTRGCDGMLCPGTDECALVEGRAVCKSAPLEGCSISAPGSRPMNGLPNTPWSAAFIVLALGLVRRANRISWGKTTSEKSK